MINLQAMFPEITLNAGAHDEGSGQLCAMELANFIAGYAHSDKAGPCTSPVIASVCRGINDGLPDAERQRLLPYLHRMLGSRGSDADEEARYRRFVTLLVTQFIPAALDSIGQNDTADDCRKAKPYPDAEELQAAETAYEIATMLAQLLGRAPSSAKIVEAHWHKALAVADLADLTVCASGASPENGLDLLQKAAEGAAGLAETCDSLLAALDDILSIGPQSSWSGEFPANLAAIFKPVDTLATAPPAPATDVRARS